MHTETERTFSGITYGLSHLSTKLHKEIIKRKIMGITQQCKYRNHKNSTSKPNLKLHKLKHQLGK